MEVRGRAQTMKDVSKIDINDFWKQLRIAYVSRLFEDIQDAKLQYLSIYYMFLIAQHIAIIWSLQNLGEGRQQTEALKVR